MWRRLFLSVSVIINVGANEDRASADSALLHPERASPPAGTRWSEGARLFFKANELSPLGACLFFNFFLFLY